MPLSTNKTAADSSVNCLINAVQYAHLLREIRRKPSMGTVFHLANYKHWKDMSTERLTLPADPDLREITMMAFSSMSCKIILQILKNASKDRGGLTSHLQTTADAEFTALVNNFRQKAETKNGALAALDGYDLFSVGLYLSDQRVQDTSPGRWEPSRLIRDCLDLLSIISQRFEGMKDLRDLLWSKTQGSPGYLIDSNRLESSIRHAKE